MKNNKINLLRKALENEEIDGYLIPTYDEFQNEYTPDYNKRLEYLTSFSGSNGVGLITKDRAILFTDGRYLLQAKEQLGDEFEVIDQADLPEFKLENQVIGYNSYLFTETQLTKLFGNFDLKIIEKDLVLEIWDDRPVRKPSQLYLYDKKYAGISAEAKIQNIREKISDSYIFVTDPTSVSWALNLRAKSDVDFCPIMLGRLILSKDSAILFGKFAEISEEIKSALPFLEFRDEADLTKHLESIRHEVIIDEASISKGLKSLIGRSAPANIVMDMQVIKSEAEVESFKQVHINDAAALCETLAWIQNAHAKGEKFSEYDIGVKLAEFRSKRPGYVMESFPAIAGFKSNGAVIHYRADEATSLQIENEGMLLIDSGGHYLGGTTDITRNLYLGGHPTPEMKRRYTQVLKGHIAIVTQKFDHGTSGVELEKAARKALQDDGVDYPHGTGHGVGNFLSVHEGSFLSPRGSEIKEGMVISNEPGFYKEGEYGIRVENLIYVTKTSSNQLAFKDLTLVPYCHNLIEFTLLNSSEIEHIHAYHDTIKQVIRPLLSDNAKKWLDGEMMSSRA